MWITGLSGSGKTTISLMLKKKLSKKYSNIVLLDGDVLRNKFKIKKKTFFLTKIEKKLVLDMYFIVEILLIKISLLSSL